MSFQETSPANYFELTQPGGICKTFTTTLLLLVSLWVPTAVCSLIFGSSGVRRKLAFFSEYRGLEDLYYTRFVFSMLGSFLLQAVVWNVSAAALLGHNRTCDPASPSCYISSRNSFTDMYWIIAVRPLAATFISLLTIINPALYLENAIEMQFVEGILGMFTIGIYDSIRKSIPNHVSWDPSLDAESVAQAQLGLKRMRDGSKLGVGMWVLSFFALLVCIPAGIFQSGRRAAQLWTCWSIFFNFMRMAAGFAIWAGVPLLQPATFCPSIATTGGMAAVWVAVTIADHMWRSLFCVGRVEWIFLSKYTELLSGYNKPGWSMDVTYFPKEEEGEEEEETGVIERVLQRLRDVAPQRPEALRLPHISGFLGRGSRRGGSVDISRA